MLNLNDREWKAFNLCDLCVIDKGIYLHRDKIIPGKKPYITAKSVNNGVTTFIENQALFEGNSITIEKINLSAYYQPYEFYCSHDVSVAISNKFNKYVALFFASVINKQGSKYSYGRQAQLNVVTRQKIMLPITDDGQPDYNFMEQYIREKEDKLQQKYLDFVNAELATPPTPLAEKAWKTFKVLDLFDYKRGNQNNMTSLADGNNMLISAKNINNGLKGFYTSTNEKKGAYKGNCITLNNDGDGGVGLAYYQPYKFLLDTHVYALYPKEKISSFVMLYLSKALSKQRVCFSHGYSISQDRLKAMKVMLPVTADGTPDYEYMEQYAKAVMYRKYKSYLEYKHS